MISRGELKTLTAKTGVGLTYVEKQLILYTKGHFKDLGKMDYDTELKYFAAETYGLYPEQVEQRSLFHMVVTLYKKLIENGYINFDLENYINQLFRRAWFYYDESNKISMKNILEYMLAEIQCTNVKGMGLDQIKPDLTIITKYTKEEN